MRPFFVLERFGALRVAIYRCGALRLGFWTYLVRIWERFWTNLGSILDNSWHIKPFKEQHHITWHTYIHTCRSFATTNRLGQEACAKRLNNPKRVQCESKVKSLCWKPSKSVFTFRALGTTSNQFFYDLKIPLRVLLGILLGIILGIILRIPLRILLRIS